MLLHSFTVTHHASCVAGHVEEYVDSAPSAAHIAVHGLCRQHSRAGVKEYWLIGKLTMLPATLCSNTVQLSSTSYRAGTLPQHLTTLKLDTPVAVGTVALHSLTLVWYAAFRPGQSLATLHAEEQQATWLSGHGGNSWQHCLERHS
jgi:hypothetical protein